MKYSINIDEKPHATDYSSVAIPVYYNDNEECELSTVGKYFDEASNGFISKLIRDEDFHGKLKETLVLYDIAGITCHKILLIGCGKKENFCTSLIPEISNAIYKALKTSKTNSVGCFIIDDLSDTQKEMAVSQLIIAFSSNTYCFDSYKSEGDKPLSLDKFIIALTQQPSINLDLTIKSGTSISKGMKLAQDLANHPSNVCTPTFLAKQSKEIADESPSISLDILEEEDMRELNMEAFLSVSKGSAEPGKTIVLQYFGAEEDSTPPIALIGKGITFDTGGISLKSAERMDEMKFDMSGAAVMLGTLKFAIEMQLPINLVVVLAVAENMPGDKAVKPGDIVKSMSGKYIEVLNTDAEGRLVLCDALTYVKKFKPEIVIDTATLTGACIVALGHHYSALLTNDDTLAKDLLEAGKIIDDPAWQLPLNDKYKEQLKSSVADIGNIGGVPAGTITAASFLSHFTQEYKWAHLDIAGTASIDKYSTGRPVPLLSQYLLNYSKANIDA